MEFQTFDPADPGVAKKLLAYGPSVAFPALHGPGGEDGTIQGFFETLGVPYVGCGVAASAICMNKLHTKWAFEALGIPTPRWTLADPPAFPQILPPFPAVAKPLTEGSSVGVVFLETESDLRALLKRTKTPVLIEERIFGRELTIPVFGHPMEMLPVIEIRPKAKFFDFEAKYTKGMTEYICPADVSPGLLEKLKKFAEKICRRLDIRHLCRIDVMVGIPPAAASGPNLPGMDRPADGQPYFLEINTLPGMTGTSLLPMSARTAGVEFPELIRRLIRMAAAS